KDFVQGTSGASFDTLDLKALLDDAFGGSGGSVNQSVVEDIYIRITDKTPDSWSIVEINADGVGSDWVSVAQLNNIGAGDVIHIVLDEDGTTTNYTV
ncbi:MAG: hypothetical protein KDJ16_17495, partial [Hyphomicrobiales bacterium]|nr:hypothetical protein [Hyphomicrobiales bacterium]